jgi:hypothetical protein
MSIWDKENEKCGRTNITLPLEIMLHLVNNINEKKENTKSVAELPLCDYLKLCGTNGYECSK